MMAGVAYSYKARGKGGKSPAALNILMVDNDYKGNVADALDSTTISREGLYWRLLELRIGLGCLSDL